MWFQLIDQGAVWSYNIEVVNSNFEIGLLVIEVKSTIA